MTAVASSPSARSARLGLRATPEQEVVLRRAAEVEAAHPPGREGPDRARRNAGRLEARQAAPEGY